MCNLLFGTFPWKRLLLPNIIHLSLFLVLYILLPHSLFADLLGILCDIAPICKKRAKMALFPGLFPTPNTKNAKKHVFYFLTLKGNGIISNSRSQVLCSFCSIYSEMNKNRMDVSIRCMVNDENVELSHFYFFFFFCFFPFQPFQKAFSFLGISFSLSSFQSYPDIFLFKLLSFIFTLNDTPVNPEWRKEDDGRRNPIILFPHSLQNCNKHILITFSKQSKGK